MGILQSLCMFDLWWTEKEQEQIILSYHPDTALHLLKKL
jgi:hypothetical protein